MNFHVPLKKLSLQSSESLKKVKTEDTKSFIPEQGAI